MRNINNQSRTKSLRMEKSWVMMHQSDKEYEEQKEARCTKVRCSVTKRAVCDLETRLYWWLQENEDNDVDNNDDDDIGSRYRNALNTKLFLLHISSSGLLLHVACAISSQYSLLDPFDHLHWSLSFNHQYSLVSRSQTALFAMLHLTCGTSFLLLFVFLITLVHHHCPAPLHLQALILD